MTNNVNKVYKEIFDYLNENHPYEATYLAKLGKPIGDSEIGKMSIRFKDGEPHMHINPEMGELPDEEKVFYTMHTAMRLLFKNDKKWFSDEDKAKLARSILINDYLEAVGFDVPENEPTGYDYIGTSTYGMTLDEVYHMMPADFEPPEGGYFGDGESGENGDEDGQGGGYAPGVGEAQDQVNEMTNGFGDNALDDGGSGCSLQGDTDPKSWSEKQGVSMNWGLILHETANLFVNLARSVPQDKIDLHVITFTTVAHRLDLDNPTFTSGGTAFQCVEDYIQEYWKAEHGSYPRSVVIVTDGASNFRGGREQTDNWHWILTDNGRFLYDAGSNIADGERYKLEDFLL
jgi:hypothetical protein